MGNCTCCSRFYNPYLEADDGLQFSVSKQITKGFQHLQWLKIYLWEEPSPYGRSSYGGYGFDDEYEYGGYGSDDEYDDGFGGAELETTEKHFPAATYAKQIEKYLLPSLPKLNVVEVDIAGNQDRGYEGEKYREGYEADYLICYTFHIDRDKGSGSLLARLTGQEESERIRDLLYS